jgi:hypothetical protein
MTLPLNPRGTMAKNNCQGKMESSIQDLFKKETMKWLE